MQNKKQNNANRKVQKKGHPIFACGAVMSPEDAGSMLKRSCTTDISFFKAVILLHYSK